MKSLTGKFSSSRGWAPLLILFLGAGLVVAACGDEEVPAPTTPAPPPPAPTPAPEPEPEPPAKPTGLMVSGRTESSITWTWNAVEGATGYVVQASRDETFDDTDQLSLTAETSFTATQLPAETNVYVRVAAGVLTAAAPSLDPKDYLLSDWTTHVTGTTDAAASAAPAAPTAVRVTARTDTTITWSWNAVDGAAGYQVQHGDRATIADNDPTAFASTTTHTVSNLESRTDRYLRVRAYVGAISEPVFGDWSRTVEGTTDSPAAPVTTQLSAPTGLRADDETTTAITLSWGEVDDAETYEVQQRPADGAWGSASCGGGDSTVSVEECEATGLTRGSNYDFRVRAHPDPDDDTLRSSGWSSTAAARTSGPAPVDPVTGGDDTLDITWESDGTTITWFWDAPSDNRIRSLVALLPSTAESCPALTDTTNPWVRTHEYARAYTAGSDTALAAGAVHGLCVRRAWTDPDQGEQYGPASLVWGATAPAGADAPRGDGALAEGAKLDTAMTKVTAIDWYFAVAAGFKYELHVVTATANSSELGDCGDSPSNSSNYEAVRSAGTDRYRVSGPATYTEYKACARAVNGEGNSGWAELETVKTRPAAVSLGASTRTTDNDDKTAKITAVTWTFSYNASMPEAPGSYRARVGDDGSDSTTALDAKSCAADFGTAATVSDIGTGFSFSTSHTFSRNASDAANKTHEIGACVQAHNGDDEYGPWAYREVTVSVPRQSN